MTQNSCNADESKNTLDSVPGSLALAVKQELDDFIFKKPLPVVEKRKSNILNKKVLDEDRFCQTIDKIIERDFFPDVEKIKTQNAYLDAVKNNDVYSLRRIYAKYSLENSPFMIQGSTRSALETPSSDALNGANEFEESSDMCKGENTTKLKNNKQSLNQFFATHISEESQHFQEMIQEDERKLKEKKPWLFVEDEQPKILTGNLPLPTSEGETLRITDGTQQKLDTWGYKDKNYIMFVPNGVEMSSKEKLEMAKVKPEIEHVNTNFLALPYDEEYSKEVISEIAYKQSRALEGKIGVDGKAITLESPNVNGFDFVKTPSPMPGVDGTPLMTWGHIEGTPFRLDGSDTPRSAISGPSFKIAEQPKREKLAFQLAEKARERYRDKKIKALETAKRQIALSSPGVARSPINKLNLMSPAAKRLVSAHLHGKFGVDNSLRSSYSPKCLTPVSSPTQQSCSDRIGSSSTPSSTPVSNVIKTPKTPVVSHSCSSKTKITCTNTSIEVNKRLKASDFFM